MPTDFRETSRINTCVSLSQKMLSVVVDMELVHLGGWQSCRTVGLGEVDWLVLLNLTGCVKSGGRVEHGDLCEVVGVVQLGELSRNSSLSVSRNGKRRSKSPSSLSTRCRSCFTPSRSKSVHNQ